MALGPKPGPTAGGTADDVTQRNLSAPPRMNRADHMAKGHPVCSTKRYGTSVTTIEGSAWRTMSSMRSDG